jgi:hypothetical protein
VIRRLLIALVVVAAAYRFSLLGHGAQAFVDETFYFTSVKALQSVSSGDIRGAIVDLSMARGRNGTALLQMPVAALQAIPAHYGVPASNLRSLLIPTACNVFVTLLSLYLVFEIGRVLCANDAAALAGAAVYAFLTSTNLYIRHLVPYDWALCVGLLALWLAVTRPQTRGLAVVTGALTGAVLTLYTGYYPLCGVVGVAILWEAWESRERGDALPFALVFAASAGAVILAMEAIFRLGGLSYIGSLRGVRRDISFTSFGDGWSFLPEYLLDVERLSGLVLILGAIVYVWNGGIRLARGILRPIDRVMLPMLVAVAAQAASSIYLHAIPLYGRLIHPWMPFLAWMLADALTRVPERRRTQGYAGVAAAALVSWTAAAWTYLPLRYPPDVLYAMGIDTTKLAADRKLCELYPGTSYASPGPLDRTTNAPYTNDDGYVLLNFCQALPEVPRPRVTETIPASATRVFDGPHWMGFPAYAYEGLIEADRAAMRRENYRLQVYRLGQ